MHVLFRTDANKDLGAGHLMRCLSLAHAMRTRGWSVTFLTCPLIPSYGERVSDAGCTLKIRTAMDDAQETEQIAREIHADWIVLDGYPFDAEYQRRLRKGRCKILCLDDQGAFDVYEVDVILNQNISAREAWYSGKAPGSRLLLGVKHVLLGPQFREWKHKRKTSTSVQRVLVTLGGADPKNITLKILRTLEMLPQSFSVDVVIGGVNLHRHDIEQYASSMKHPAHVLVDTKDMPSLMDRADLAIAAAGTTSWELLFMGVPFVTGAFARNQRANAEELGKQNVAINAGWYPDAPEEALSAAIGALIDDAETRAFLSRRGLGIIDGKGADRVCDVLSVPLLKLREVTGEDSNLLFSWANDPVVRASSLSPDPIAWEQHQEWLRGKIADPHCNIYIGMNGKGTPVGQIRFDVRDDGDAEIDVHLAPDQRGKGLGSPLIIEGIQRIFAQTQVTTVHAYVKTDNEGSRKAFLKAGFNEQGKATRHGKEVYHLVFNRS